MRAKKIKMVVLPGGIMPRCKTPGAVGYDAYVRAIISLDEMDPENPLLRKALFDFKTMPSDPETARHVMEGPRDDGDGLELMYILKPHEAVLVGLGFLTEMPYPLFYWIAPRGGLATRSRITVENPYTIVDSDYRGEAGVLIGNHGKKPFILRQGMGIVQIAFLEAKIPKIEVVEKPEDLSPTSRGSGAYGSTGLK